MEEDRQSGLPECFDSLGLTENLGSRWKQEMLAVVGIDRVRKQTFDGPRKLAVEPVNQNGFENRPLERM